jgi:hypothetical protein
VCIEDAADGFGFGFAILRKGTDHGFGDFDAVSVFAECAESPGVEFVGADFGGRCFFIGRDDFPAELDVVGALL